MTGQNAMALKANFTPGPWVVQVHRDTTSVEGRYTTVAPDVSNDDAPLIAAAPDLLAALRNMVEQSASPDYNFGPCDAAMTAARAAIAKATA